MIEMELKHHVINAIFSIRPNSEFTVGDTYESLNWFSEDQVKPTEAEFNTALASVKAEFDALAYSRKREAEFPSIPDQLDEIYHNGLDSWKAIIKQTKDKYPKG